MMVSFNLMWDIVVWFYLLNVSYDGMFLLDVRYSNMVLPNVSYDGMFLLDVRYSSMVLPNVSW